MDVSSFSIISSRRQQSALLFGNATVYSDTVAECRGRQQAAPESSEATKIRLAAMQSLQSANLRVLKCFFAAVGQQRQSQRSPLYM